ncbi:unnamed protein product [Brachionus calyciflorus]|uniref:Uncharacterized protein n=1 Tax=Brachionus calyciflorus TaxID=104777 RepID=A0A814CH05_9BILA|nr:unnamed protein product [Brachionus calyciflorus]
MKFKLDSNFLFIFLFKIKNIVSISSLSPRILNEIFINIDPKSALNVPKIDSKTLNKNVLFYDINNTLKLSYDFKIEPLDLQRQITKVSALNKTNSTAANIKIKEIKNRDIKIYYKTNAQTGKFVIKMAQGSAFLFIITDRWTSLRFKLSMIICKVR